MSKAVNVSVSLSDVGGNPHKLIRKFIKKCKKERIVEEYRDRIFYEKPSTKKRREKKRKLRNARKAEAERNRGKN
jgi:ribosomal protein S21